MQLFENRREVQVQDLIEAGVQAGVEMYQPVAIFRGPVAIFARCNCLSLPTAGCQGAPRVARPDCRLSRQDELALNYLLRHVVRKETELACQFVSHASLILPQ